jgi:sterol desaturase/sphingolipid hydroxylase (fatty acid hydroxylase superfamily)
MSWPTLASLVHSPELRSLSHGTLMALFVGVVFYCIVYFLERASGGPTKQYAKRGFLQDIVYWFYYRSGLHRLLFTTVLFGLLGPRIAFLRLPVLDHLSIVWRTLLWLLIADLSSYWVHRMQHASRFFWAFHATHHAQEDLNFMTTTRFHPVDHLLADTLKFVPQMALGASPLSWLPLYLTMDFLAITQHSRIAWRFGPLSKVLATPWFHSFHHSTDPRHYNKNFGGLFSFWDYLFGTAVDAPQQPAEYGLTDIKMPTLVSSLSKPFGLLYRTYFQKPAPSEAAARALAASGTDHGPPRA